MEMPKVDQKILRKAAKIFGWAALLLWPGASMGHVATMWLSRDYLQNALNFARYGEPLYSPPLLAQFPLWGVACFATWVVIWSVLLTAKLRAKLLSKRAAT